MIKKTIGPFLVLFVLTGCGSVLYLKTETDPFHKFQDKGSYNLFVLIPEEATPEDKKAAKNLMDIIATLKNCSLSTNVTGSDFIMQITSSQKTYKTVNSNGYIFLFPLMNVAGITSRSTTQDSGEKEINLYVNTSEKVAGSNQMKLKTVWSGYARVDKDKYKKHPKTFIKELFMKFGNTDIDKSVDIRPGNYID